MAELGVHQSALLTDLALCINRYRLLSPGWYVCVLAKVQLASDEWEVPGLTAMVNYGRQKQCEVQDEVFHGAPNFILDVFEDYDDLARALGCTASAARVRMHRAMQQLNATFTRMNGVPIDV